MSSHQCSFYCNRVDYRYHSRKIEDSDRTKKAIKMTAGKRLMYRQPVWNSEDQ